MTLNKRKKNSRMHGTHTHGYGGKKKHRGAGSRGGRGMAGTGKKGDVQKPSIWGNTNYFGKQGFHSHRKTKFAINISYFNNQAEKLLLAKKIEKEGDFFIIDCKKLKINKILGSGKLKIKLKIKADSITPKAMEKIQNAGGEIIE